jgi:hypothetical protein
MLLQSIVFNHNWGTCAEFCRSVRVGEKSPATARSGERVTTRFPQEAATTKQCRRWCCYPDLDAVSTNVPGTGQTFFRKPGLIGPCRGRFTGIYPSSRYAFSTKKFPMAQFDQPYQTKEVAD